MLSILFVTRTLSLSYFVLLSSLFLSLICALHVLHPTMRVLSDLSKRSSERMRCPSDSYGRPLNICGGSRFSFAKAEEDQWCACSLNFLIGRLRIYAILTGGNSKVSFAVYIFVPAVGPTLFLLELCSFLLYWMSMFNWMSFFLFIWHLMVWAPVFHLISLWMIDGSCSFSSI